VGGFPHSIDARSPDAERLGDVRGAEALSLHLAHRSRVYRGAPALIKPAAFALAIPSSCRSFRRFVSNSADTPSMSKKHLPAALPVSIGCSVAFNEAPRAHLADDVLQVDNASSQSINTCDHQDVAVMEKIENRPQLIMPLCGCAAALLGSDHIASGRPQGGVLN
jgi:hypothetical protein